jgi:ATP-binding cassette, subfamily B, multidrug efflux pump
VVAAISILLWVGDQKVLSGDVTVGTLAEHLAYMVLLPARPLGMMVNFFARASMSGGRLFEVFDTIVRSRDRHSHI